METRGPNVEQYMYANVVVMSWDSRLDDDLRRQSVTRRMRYKWSIVHGMAHERSRMYRPWE